MSARKEIEFGSNFTPQFDSRGLIPVIAQDFETCDVLMVAYMNEEALEKTVRTGKATYYSRSRNKLWTKGEESGHVQEVRDILVDCDQDCLILKVSVNSGQCHTGYQSCFYRRVKPGSKADLEFIAQPVYDPDKVYKK